MSLSALALVVLAGLIHASWNIAAKKAGGDHRFALLSALLVTVVWAPAGLCGRRRQRLNKRAEPSQLGWLVTDLRSSMV